jgi:hypothetical protein
MGIEKSSMGRCPRRLGSLSCSLFLLFVSLYCSFSHAFVTSSQRNAFHPSQSVSHAPFSSLSSSSWSLTSCSLQPRSCVTLSSSKTSDVVGKVIEGGWFPRTTKYDDDIFNEDEDDAIAKLENDAVQLALKCIKNRLDREKDVVVDDIWLSPTNSRVAKLVNGRFMDLTCSTEGERALESLFSDPVVAKCEDNNVIRGAVVALQSLCVMATQAGVTGVPEQLHRTVKHLYRRDDPTLLARDLFEWDRDSIRRLKYRIDRKAALHLLTEILWKRTSQGAFDLLVAIGAWKKHDDLALLRSGFPLRFTKEETDAATAAFDLAHDPDQILGLREDFRHMKVFTIDSASTSEIDDGLSIEVVQKDDGTERHRIWIHIADADRWAPRNSTLFEISRRRITSLYLPNGAIAMFPAIASADLMSLKANQDACALSLGVELNSDGSIDASTITFTPSTIRVSYRLTYDDVDEMLEEGIGYSEEWELGALLDVASKRRNYRIRNGSTEGLVPNPVPYSSVSMFPDKSAPDAIGISINVQVSHNAGKNRTAEADSGGSDADSSVLVEPSSSANLLVTEAMIMAGEALGRWKMRLDEEEEKQGGEGAVNQIRLPFRTQPQPGNFPCALILCESLCECTLSFTSSNCVALRWAYHRF